MPLAPRSQRLRNAQATRAERLRRRKFRRNLFTFIVAQLVIAGVAFVGVRDYMSDGYIKHAVADVLKQIAGVRLRKPRPIRTGRCRPASACT